MATDLRRLSGRATRSSRASGNNDDDGHQLAINFENAAMQNQIGQFAVTRSQRNPTALFGAGLIDSIAESDIEAGGQGEIPGVPPDRRPREPVEG